MSPPSQMTWCRFITFARSCRTPNPLLGLPRPPLVCRLRAHSGWTLPCAHSGWTLPCTHPSLCLALAYPQSLVSSHQQPVCRSCVTLTHPSAWGRPHLWTGCPVRLHLAQLLRRRQEARQVGVRAQAGHSPFSQVSP